MALEGASGQGGGGATHEEAIRAIGAAIRERRQGKGMSLQELSDRTGLSTGFLSLVERGRSSLAITSLYNVAQALEVDVATFLPGERAVERSHPLPHVTRAEENSKLEMISSERTYKILSPRGPGLTLEPLLVTVQPSDELEEPYPHEGEEFAYILSGELVYLVDGERYRLGVGDSIHVKSTVPHAIYNDTDRPAQILWVLTPRIFR
jgi:transcriptional regulator with XRE-family HTH domain